MQGRPSLAAGRTRGGQPLSCDPPGMVSLQRAGLRGGLGGCPLALVITRVIICLFSHLRDKFLSLEVQGKLQSGLEAFVSRLNSDRLFIRFF